MDMRNKQKGGYDVLMDHITVTPEMAERITRNLQKEAASHKKKALHGHMRWVAGIAACAAVAILCIALLPMLQAPDNHPGPLVGIPLPPQHFESLEGALAELTYEAQLPSSMPEGYELSGCMLYEGAMLQLTYTNGENSIVYRTAEGSNDISGDYERYSEETTVENDAGVSIALKGNASGYHSARWTNGGMAYSLHSDVPLSESELLRIVNSVQED